MAITEELLDQLIADYKKPEDLIGENGLLKQLTKRLLERAMQAEITDHLGYAKHALSGSNSGNSRNGSYKKKVKGEFGELDIAVPGYMLSSVEQGGANWSVNSDFLMNLQGNRWDRSAGTLTL